MKSKIYDILITLVFSLAAVSCAEDPLYDPSYIGEGEAEVTAEVTFTPLCPALSRAVSGGTPGDAIKEIENLCIVFYNEKNEYVNHFFYDEPTTEKSTAQPDDVKYNENSPHRAETATKKATVKIPKLSYGKYHIYAVANVAKELLTDEIVENIENLKKFTLEWNEENVAANNQMFGYFSANNASKGFDAPEIVINKKNVTLHAWIKRAASKVTVAFDGTGLKDGVEIFIKSVTIKDIPKYCYLSADNPETPSEDGVAGSDNEIGKIEIIDTPDQIITYYPDNIDPTTAIPAESYNENWPGYVSKTKNINGFGADGLKEGMSDSEKLAALHSETTNAFYFYENLQGKGKEGTPTDKHQQVNQQDKTDGVVSYPDGIDPTNISWKDAKKYGSYIEVKAYYKSGNEKEGEGEITYRFMLGKDAALDYNAERNHHYKLTLKFKGWANDVDWHIDYRKEPETKLRFPHPFYISYLYGQTAMIPLEFDAPKDVKIKNITARIITNNWSPLDCKDGFDGGTAQPSNWWNGAYARYVSTSNVVNNKPWNGFLSLRKPVNLVALPEPKNLEHNEPSILNKEHYEDENLGYRLYSADELKISDYQLYEAMDDDKPHVSWDNGTYYVKIPIWTRARQLIARTGYTGNNPYNAYYRQAIVNVVVELEDGTILDSSDSKVTMNPDDAIQNIEVKQVHRLVNPKGIYRSSNNTKSFDVELKVLEDDADVEFKNLKSAGPWRAYVIRESDENFISLEGFSTDKRPDTTSEADYTFKYSGDILTRRSIEGRNDTEIAFRINFNGTSNGVPRYAIIRVEYNYYSCYHLIFVRQGYEAHDTFDNGIKWCTGNNISKDEITSNPLDEGTLFKFGNWNGIKTGNNVNSKTPWRKITPDNFKQNAANKKLEMTDSEPLTWDEITNENLLTETSFPKPGGNRRIATMEDYSTLVPKDLTNAAEVENWHIKTGYGICYGDEADKTANTIDDAFGYKPGGSATGMRGCFVYDTRTGGNIFFPIGSSGYGHRKHNLKHPTDGSTYYGVLRYSCNDRWGYFNTTDNGIYKYGVYDAPLFLDIFRSEGAIYWFDKSSPSVEEENNKPQTFYYPAWDINYSTFDFEKIRRDNIWKSIDDKDPQKSGYSDACFIRCIQE